jgi:pimeloyl-ACP methyl ester carboxylesterase
MSRLTDLLSLPLALAALGSTACVGSATAESATPRAQEAAPATLLSSPDRFFTAGDVTLRYRELGAGQPVLLIHGYSDRVEMWAGPADSLARTHRVIVPDVRGFGRSTRFADPERYGASMVDDLLALLDHLGVERVHVIGYSMGGLLAAQLAAREPSRTASATLVAGAFYRDSADAKRVLSPYADSLATGHGLVPFMRWIVPLMEDQTLRSITADVMTYNETPALIAVLRSIPSIGVSWDDVERSTVPMAAVVGPEDPLFEHSRRIVSHWPGSRLLEARGADHITVTNTPEMLAAFRSLQK